MTDHPNRRRANWPLRLYVAAVLLAFPIGAIVIFVKAAAWWRVAFGSC